MNNFVVLFFMQLLWSCCMYL